MRALEFSVIVFFLASGGECFLRMPPKSQFQNREKVQVQVHAKGPENKLPLEYELDFNLDGSDIHVHLRENPKIKTNVEVFAMKSGSLVRKYAKDKEESVFYQDADNGAIFVIQSNGTGGANMMGFLQKGNYHFVLQSDDDFSVGGVNVPFDVLKEPIKVTDFADVDDTVNRSTRLSRRKRATGLSRRKRATGEYAVELLIAVDYAVYMYWYEQSTAPTPAERETEAIESIKQFYAFVINGVDAMYKNIQTSSYTISVLFSEIIIAQTPEDSPWTEDIKDTSFDPPRVDSSTALNNFRSWIQSQQNLPGHDHAMLFTRYDLVYQGSSANSGLAYTSTACSTSSQSIVEDSFNFVMLTIAAHELGHSLGAAHDGTGNVCSADDGYIMAPSTGPRQDPSLATNAWEFSSCSTNYFTNYLDSIGSPNCLQVLDAAYNASALAQFEGQLPGQVYDADTQCRLIEGPDSYMCRHIYEGNFSTICTTLWCKNPDEWFSCTGSVAADGTVCGDQKWCISGVCTYDPQAPSGDESCLYGDMIGYLFAQYNWTCFDVINNAPQQCEQVPIKCCDTCESVLSTTSTTTTTTTTTTTPEIAQLITLQDADLQCEVANGPGSIFCRQAYHGTFELICYIGLVCTSPTDVLNCTHAIIPANGTLCGNQKWCLPGPYCGFDENAPTVEDERCLYGDVIGYTYNGWNCSDLVVNAPEYCDNNDAVKLRCCESCAQRIIASTTLTLEQASTTLSPTTTLEQSTSTSTTTTTIQPSTTSSTTTTTIDTSTTTSSTTTIEPSTATSSATTTIEPSTTTSSTTTTTLAPSTTTSSATTTIEPSTTTSSTTTTTLAPSTTTSSATTTIEPSTTTSSTTTTIQSPTTTSSTTTTIEPSTTTSSTTTTIEPSTTTSSTTTTIQPSTATSSTSTTVEPSTTTSSTTTTIQSPTTTSSTTTTVEPSTTTSSTTTTIQSSTTTSSTTTTIEPSTTTSSTTTTIEPSTTTSSTTTTIEPSTTTSSTTTTIGPTTTTSSTTTTIQPSTTTSTTTTTIGPTTTTSSTTTTIQPSTTTSSTTLEPSTTTSSTTTTIQTSFTTYSTTTEQPTATLQPPMSTITTPPTYTVPKKKCHNRHNTYPGK